MPAKASNVWKKRFQLAQIARSLGIRALIGIDARTETAAGEPVLA